MQLFSFLSLHLRYLPDFSSILCWYLHICDIPLYIFFLLAVWRILFVIKSYLKLFLGNKMFLLYLVSLSNVYSFYWVINYPATCQEKEKIFINTSTEWNWSELEKIFSLFWDPNLYQIYEKKRNLLIGTATCAKIQTQIISIGWHW